VNRYSEIKGSGMKRNLDTETVKSFGDEWSRFDQLALSEQEAQRIFDSYFGIFPWGELPPNASGFDMGCGSGRWAKLVAPKVGHLHCIDPSGAIDVARKGLAGVSNISFHRASVADDVLPRESQDFGYSLGVLHHVPDTASAVASCSIMLKPGAPFLAYLYYAFDNRPAHYRLLWSLSDLMRRFVCRLPPGPKHLLTNSIALLVYLPLARAAKWVERAGLDVSSFPLSHYRHHSFYTMLTDSRDRFGTPLEQRFTRRQIKEMFEAAGLEQVQFSEQAPYWCAVGRKK
jgi:SAM-dependent methyltransferase